MSPLLRDELEVVLAPSRVSMARYGMAWSRRGLRRRLIAEASADCRAAEPGASAWSGALRALDEQLRGMPGARADLRVVLSNQFVRYAVVPWQAGLSANEDAAYLRHYFAQMFGCSADGWDICAVAAPEGEPRVASAIDAALLLALRELCALEAIRLKAVLPQFASTFERCRLGLPASGWIVQAGTGCLCIGLFEARRWLSIRTLRTGPAWRQDLPALLAREACLANPAGEVGDVLLCAPDQGDGPALPEGRFRFHAVPAGPRDAAGVGRAAMRPLRLNHQARVHTARSAPASALLLLALAANVAGGWYYADLNGQRASALEAARMAGRRGGPAVASGRAGGLQTELARVNDTVRALSVPWDEVFGAVEAAGSADVSLLALDPMPDKRMLKLLAEARNMDAVLVYLRALAAEPAFAAVSLQSHQVQQADPNHPVRIVVLAEWKGRP